MIIKLINNPFSSLFNQIVELGDDNNKTLGFLPEEVFRKYAKEKQLIGAIDEQSNSIIGYLLYRVAFGQVTIIHLCVDKSKRNKNIAKKLVDYLKNNTKQYIGIRLSCRNDYGIDDFWQKLNFIPIDEKAGRGKERLPLTIWVYKHYKEDLFTQYYNHESENKIVAVIDMNIFLDIKEKREQESLALMSDWVQSETILYYTREINNEINKASSKEARRDNRVYLSHFEELPFKEETPFYDVLQELKSKFPINHNNDYSDLKHIAYSIVGKAEYFITRDKHILDNKKYFFKYNLKICRPSEFIAQLDENIQASKYQPQNLLGTSINTKRVKVEDINSYIKAFLKPNEKKYYFEKIIREALANPNKYELITITKETETLAFLIFDKTDKEKLRIPIFRLSNNNIRYTLAKHLIYKSIFEISSTNISEIEICERYLERDIEDAIKSLHFFKIENTWKKYSLKGIYSFNELLLMDNLKLEKNLDTVSKKEELYNYERSYYPLKIKDLDIPNYIVPIKSYWAEQLFYDRSNEKLPLFEPEYELLLNKKNVYYKSSKPNVLSAPARVLWYISSDNKKNQGKGKIVATSYIDEIFIDNPKKLFKQFKKLGIYKWKDIQKTSKNSDTIMAFIFSETELFNRVIGIDKLKQVYKNFENKNFLIVSPIKIKNKTYIELYKKGMEYDR